MRQSLLAAAVAAPLAAAAAAAEDAPDAAALLEVIRAQQAAIAALEARVSELETRATSGAATAASDAAAPIVATPDAAAEIVALPQAAPRLDGPGSDGPTTPIVIGRFNADAWTTDATSGTEMRRARLGVRGDLGEDLSYVVDIDFAGQTVALQDVILDRRFGDAWTLRLGYHKIPFSLGDQTSDNYNLFMEYAAATAPFTPGRGVGAAAMTTRGDVYLHAGVFGEGDNNARDSAVDENASVGGRAVWAPGHDGDAMVHLGASAFHTWVSDDAPTARFRARPERNLSAYALDTGPIPADALSALGLEAAVNVGAFGAAAETAWTVVDMPAGGDATLSGATVEAWWTLTGEHRPYKINGGVFNRMSPARPVTEGGSGAWQVAARYSTLDLADDVVQAGELEVAALALNWHWTDRVRVMLNANRSKTTHGLGPTVTEDGLGARFQVDW